MIRKLCPKIMTCSFVCFVAIWATGAAAPRQEGLGKGKKQKKQTVFGEPKQFKPGKITAYAVWRAKNGWHLRVTTANKRQHFKGSVTAVGGKFVEVHSARLEKKKKSKVRDRWKLGPKKQNVRFDFLTDEGVDGINFRVSKGTKAVRFDLHIDGKHRPKLVFIGRNGRHPKKMPFSLPVAAKKKKKQ